MTLLYLHGFTSGPQSNKAVALRQRMETRGLGEHFLCPQLPPSPAAAISLADGLIERYGVTAVVGSSLGGYYATWLAEHHKLRAVLVNPAVVAHVALEKYLGPHRMIYSGESFEFTRQHVDELRANDVAALSHPENFWLLAEAGDETLDYRRAVAYYAGCRQTVLDGGDHSFTRWNEFLDPVIEFAGL